MYCASDWRLVGPIVVWKVKSASAPMKMMTSAACMAETESGAMTRLNRSQLPAPRSCAARSTSSEIACTAPVNNSRAKGMCLPHLQEQQTDGVVVVLQADRSAKDAKPDEN